MYDIVITFCLGVGILLFSTQKLVRLAEKISRILRISPLIVGVTIVAIGTSLPELAVSLVSIIKHDTGLAFGNIIGSNIVNVLLVFPVSLFIGKLRIGTTKTQQNVAILIGVTAVFFLTRHIWHAEMLPGLVLIGLAVIVSVMEYKLAIFGRKHEDLKQLKVLKKEKITVGSMLLVILLVSGIVFGGILVVSTVEKISIITGISTTILGLTLTAIATSLPELMTTIFSQGDHQEKITTGNVIGSNIYNLLLVGGVISLFSPTTVIQSREWVWLGITTLGFGLILSHYKGRKPPKKVGFVLFIILFIYLFSQG